MHIARVITGLVLMAVVAASGCQESSKPSAPSTEAKTPQAESPQSKAPQAKAPDASADQSPAPVHERTANSESQVSEQAATRPATEKSPPAHSDSPADSQAAQAAVDSVPMPTPSSSSRKWFADWPKPDAVLVISGEQLGYIEPCGCAGLENQKGGLARRHTLLKRLADQQWPVAAIDLGNQVKRFGPQQEIKFHTTIEALKTMGYAAIAFGPDDLRLPVGELIADVANDASGFVSANIDIKGFEEIVPPFRVIERGGRKIAITSILGETAWQKVNNEELAYEAAEPSLAKVVDKMREQADTLVLLSHAEPEESLALAKRFPAFQIVVTAGGADEPPAEPTIVEETGAWLVEVGHKGMYVAAIGLYSDKDQPRRYQRVPLDKRLESSKAMQNLMVAYQGQLFDRGFEGLGLQPVAHSSGRQFVGSQVCGDCHTKAHEIWSNSPHSHATQTLVDLEPPRQFDPECVSCHVTGWDPQKYFPYASGFVSLDKTPLLKANGCENCHGPGSKHVAVELGEMEVDDAERTKLREQMRLPLELAEKSCRTCHDHDNSPEFDFETYWPQVEHYGKD